MCASGHSRQSIVLISFETRSGLLKLRQKSREHIKTLLKTALDAEILRSCPALHRLPSTTHPAKRNKDEQTTQDKNTLSKFYSAVRATDPTLPSYNSRPPSHPRPAKLTDHTHVQRERGTEPYKHKRGRLIDTQVTRKITHYNSIVR